MHRVAYRCLVVLCLAVLSLASGSVSLATAADPKLAELKEPPPGLSAEVASAINATGYRISDDSGVVCDLWMARQIPLKPGFKPSLRIKYPFSPGELVGAIRFPETSMPHDFRGQEMKPGVYTLRYGLQPDDGNHLGTSDIRDFLVGCPPADDRSPARIEEVPKLFKLSAGASGTTHPAIFLLNPPPEKPVDAAGVRHDDEHNLLILDANGNGKSGEKAQAVPLSIVVLGITEA